MKKLRSIAEANPGVSRLRGAPPAFGDASHALLDADARVFLPEAEAQLGIVERAEGTTLFDRDGHEMLDFSGSGARSLGYGHPRVLAAVRQQIETLAFSPPGYTNPPAIALAQRLAELAPGDLHQVLLTASNEAAVVAALDLARVATGRHRILCVGDTVRRLGALVPGVEDFLALDRSASALGEAHGFAGLGDLIDALLSRGADFAALIAEPMAWASVTAPPPSFWQRVKDSCMRAGTLLIFDETPSAVGATGTMFYAEQAGAVPDILLVGEGLGGGIVPVAALIANDLDAPARAAAAERLAAKSPLAAAAALATLEVIAEEELLERARGLGHRGLDHLQAIASRVPIVAGARGVGLALGVEIAGPNAEARCARIAEDCRDRGLNLGVGAGNVLLLAPPLTVAVPEIERAFAILEAAAARA